MARFLIGTVPLTGHVIPLLPLVRTLVERGHDVSWYAGRKFGTAIVATGARFLPMSASVDFDESHPEAAFPGLRGLTGIARVKAQITNFFINSMPGQYAELTAILRDFPADVLVGDVSCGGVALVAEKRGMPWATLNVTSLSCVSRDTAPFGSGLPPDYSCVGRIRNHLLNMLIFRVVFRDINARYRQARAQVGLPTQTTYFEAFSPFLYLQPTIPSFEYPRSDLPPQVHFIGPLLPQQSERFIPPDWWKELGREQPVVLVTQGTLAPDPSDLIVPTLRALADEDVLVVATTGAASRTSIGIDPVPANVRVERFLPYAHLMPNVDVMITNGGYGGVQLALAHGVPLIAAGTTEEKPETAMRIAWTGVGVNLQTQTPTPAQIQAAVRRLLTTPYYRQQAQRLQAECARYDAPRLATRLLEELAVTKQPIMSIRVRLDSARQRQTDK